MKKLFLILVTTLCITTINAQNSEQGQGTTAEVIQSKSKAVTFMDKEGSFVMKEFFKLGKVKGVECDVLILTDLKDKVKLGCLRLLTDNKSTIPYVGVLDSDEIADAVTCMEYIKNNVLPNQPNEEIEVYYYSRDNVKIGVYTHLPFNNTTQKPSWKIFVRTARWRDSAEYLDSKHLDKLIEYFKSAKKIIEEKTR